MIYELRKRDSQQGGVMGSAAVVKKAKPISISLPPEVIQDLEDRVRANKLSGEGPRTVSGLIKEALKQSGYKISN